MQVSDMTKEQIRLYLKGGSLPQQMLKVDASGFVLAETVTITASPYDKLVMPRLSKSQRRRLKKLNQRLKGI